MPSKRKPQPAPPERTQPRPYREVLEERRRNEAQQQEIAPLPQGEFLPEPAEDGSDR